MNHLRLAWAIAKGALGMRSPIYVQFALTKRCNLACRMCNSNRSRGAEEELGLEGIGQVADVLRKLGVGVLVLTGGEPFLRDDLPEIIQIFAERGIIPRLQTNGLLATETSLRACVDAGLQEVTLSLDTLDEQLQDDINGRAGSWRQTIEALALFSAVLPQHANMSGVNVVVSKRNLGEVPTVVRFIDAIGFYASLIPIHVAAGGSEAMIIRKQAEGFALGPDDHPRIEAVYQELMDMKRGGTRIQNSMRFLRESPDFLKWGKTKWKCDSPRLFFSLSPSGSFLPCVDVPYERPILAPGFVEDYRSGKIAKEIAPLVAACPGCMYACWPEIAYACSHFPTLLDRGKQAVKLRRDSRPQLTSEDMLAIANSLTSQRQHTPCS